MKRQDSSNEKKPVELNNMSFRFPGSESELLRGINLEVNRGEVLAIMGLSGSGKSTLCYCISGIIPHIKKGIIEGEVKLQGRSVSEMTIPEVSRMLGMVLQDPDTQLFSPTVEDEIAFGPENFGLPWSEIDARIERVIEKVGIQQHRYKNPRELSGGEKQLVAIAAVLSLEPDILIFDEALSQLDAAGREMIMELIVRLKDEGKAIIMVEHNPDNLGVADRIKLLKNGEMFDLEPHDLKSHDTETHDTGPLDLKKLVLKLID